MTYEELYNLVKTLLQSIYGIDIPGIPQSKGTPPGKTFMDVSPTGQSCSWSSRILPIYQPKEWEKNPIIGSTHDDP